jgi:hypothetical protein
MKQQLSSLSGIIVLYVILLKIISRLTGKAFCFYTPLRIGANRLATSCSNMSDIVCTLRPTRPHRPDAIRQRDAIFQFSKTKKSVNG